MKFFGDDKKPIIPLLLKLTDQEKMDLVMFVRALQVDSFPAIIAEPKAMPD